MMRDLGKKSADQAGSALASLMLALSARERDASLHSVRVASYAVLLGRRMGVDSQTLEVVRQGALLHDIGKIGVSDTISRKPTRLTEHEWAEMKKHSEIGYHMLLSTGYTESVARVALSHHESVDGSGYPAGLEGDAIPLAARIVSLADSFDAMTSDRPYREAMPFGRARREIEKHAGRQFDALVVLHFLEVPREEWAATARQIPFQRFEDCGPQISIL